MTLAAVRANIGELRIEAAVFVRRYAKRNRPDVPTEFVDAICRALGEISLDEATAAIERWPGQLGEGH